MEAGALAHPTERRISQPVVAGRRTAGEIPRLRVTGVRGPRAAYRAVPGASIFYPLPQSPLPLHIDGLPEPPGVQRWPVAIWNERRDSQMRIALVTEFYYPHLGGVTEHVHNLALEFRRRGHDAIVITANMKGQGTDPPFVRR